MPPPRKTMTEPFTRIEPSAPATVDGNTVTMPRTLTTRMLRAAEQVLPSITIDETPYLDRLYAALIAAYEKENEHA